MKNATPSEIILKSLIFRDSAIFFALVTIWFELQSKFPKGIIITFPIVGILILSNLYILLGENEKIYDPFFTARGFLALLCFGLLMMVCSIPVNQIRFLAPYLKPSPNPFHGYIWLGSSLFGILFSIFLLNYILFQPRSPFPKTIQGCWTIWQLPVRYFLIIFSGMVFIISNFFSLCAFQHIPHVQDEIAQFFQAKIFATGHLKAPLPPLIDFFRHPFDNMIFTDGWYSQYPPGHSFLLMFGVIFRIPWIINPLLASLSCILLFWFVQQFYGEREARLSVILFSSSPFILFMSASFMNHVSTLFFLLLFLSSLEKSRREKKSHYAFIAGISIGFMLNIRPQDALILGILFGFYFFLCCLREKIYFPLIALISAIGIMTGILLLYNYLTNGSPFLFGYQIRWGRNHTFGFTKTPLMDRPPHTPLRGLMNTLSNLIALNENLFEWPLPSLIPLFIFWTPFLFSKNSKDYLLLLGAVAAPCLYFFYFFQDLCLGPRFYYISLPFILAMTAKSIILIPEKIAILRNLPQKKVKDAFILLLLISTLFAGIVRVPKLYLFYSKSYWHVDNKLMKKVQSLKITNALIFQKSYYYEQDKGSNVGSGLLYNSPELKGPIVFARNLGKRNRELLPYFPGRNYYLASRDPNGEVIIEPLKIQTPPLPKNSGREKN